MANDQNNPAINPEPSEAPEKSPSKAGDVAAPASPEAKPVGKTMSKKQPSKTVETFLPPTNNKESESDTKLTPFQKQQKERLLALRDGMLDSMAGVAKDNLRARAEGSEASAFGMHQADAGSDAYDRDFALSLLSQEQDALNEIEEALKRLDAGTYGICEMSGKQIPEPRLEAIPFARYTVECQAQLEKQRKATRVRQPVTSLFGLTDDDSSSSDGDDDDSSTDLKE